MLMIFSVEVYNVALKILNVIPNNWGNESSNVFDLLIGQTDQPLVLHAPPNGNTSSTEQSLLARDRKEPALNIICWITSLWQKPSRKQVIISLFKC